MTDDKEARHAVAVERDLITIKPEPVKGRSRSGTVSPPLMVSGRVTQMDCEKSITVPCGHESVMVAPDAAAATALARALRVHVVSVVAEAASARARTTTSNCGARIRDPSRVR